MKSFPTARENKQTDDERILSFNDDEGKFRNGRATIFILEQTQERWLVQSVEAYITKERANKK